MINKGLFSSNSNEWYTPKDLYNKLNKEFQFTLDPCCTDTSALCDKYYTAKDDGLRSIRGATVVCLIPARTDTAYWHDYCFKGEVRFLRGRLSFSNKGTAPFPSAVVIFRGDK